MNTTQSNNGIQHWKPEMGDMRPATKIEASLSYNGGYSVHSAVPLSGRGVRLLSTIKPGDCVNNRRDGWGHYQVTAKAFEAIKAKHAVAMECLL